jgi:hypothetical protein
LSRSATARNLNKEISDDGDVGNGDRGIEFPLDGFLVFPRLGLTSLGGPIAHLDFFRSEFVDRRKWREEAHCADIVAPKSVLARAGQ